MHHFQYKGEELYCEEVPVRLIAEKVGTPCYIYSQATLSHHFMIFDSAFADAAHLICYSVKANSNIAILRLFARWAGELTSCRAVSSIVRAKPELRRSALSIRG